MASDREGRSEPPGPDGNRRSATLHIAPGETYDFEITPRSGDSRIVVMSASTSTMAVTARD